MSDCGPPGERTEQLFSTRALAAYALICSAEASPQEAAISITDGSEDNGIDAVFFNVSSNRLYIVQSKWKESGKGAPDSAETKKFATGIRDLFNGTKKERFNAKFDKHWDVVKECTVNPGTRFELILVHSGTEALGKHALQDLNDVLAEMNDPTELMELRVLSQLELYESLADGMAGIPIDLSIELKSWGKVESPHGAFYGQVSGVVVADWWRQHHSKLFSKNIRNVLGDTDVNQEIIQTLWTGPENFWYFNNGITITAKAVSKSIGGRDSGTFHCQEVSVVNGAQTVSCLGRFGYENHSALETVWVPLRIIVTGVNKDFGEAVTRTNNRQNKIEARDFVSLDHRQHLLRRELAVDGIDYQVTRIESFVRSERSFDFVEGVTALACASSNVRIIVQLKREISKLWDDLHGDPYTELFSPDITGLRLWRCVQIQRRIDAALVRPLRSSNVQAENVRVHGNRLVAGLVFTRIPAAKIDSIERELDEFASQGAINSLVDDYVNQVRNLLEANHAGSIVSSFFKSALRCEETFLTIKMLEDLPDDTDPDGQMEFLFSSKP